jgi:hypothetical protein
MTGLTILTGLRNIIFIYGIFRKTLLTFSKLVLKNKISPRRSTSSGAPWPYPVSAGGIGSLLNFCGTAFTCGKGRCLMLHSIFSASVARTQGAIA